MKFLVTLFRAGLDIFRKHTLKIKMKMQATQLKHMKQGNH